MYVHLTRYKPTKKLNVRYKIGSYHFITKLSYYAI